MPYIDIAQRYNTAKAVSPNNHLANTVEKMDRTKPHISANVMPAHPGHQIPNPIPHGLPTATKYDGYRRDGPSDAPGARPAFGYGGYEQAGYRQAFFKPNYQAQALQTAADHNGFYGQWTASQPYGGQGYQGTGYRGGYSTSLQPAFYYQSLYTAPPATQAAWQFCQEQQQYAPSQFQQQPYYHQYAQNQYPQPLLTQQWQVADDVPPPPPPPESAHTPSFSANAVPHRPVESVTAAGLNKLYRVNKMNRYDQKKPNATVNNSYATDDFISLPAWDNRYEIASNGNVDSKEVAALKALFQRKTGKRAKGGQKAQSAQPTEAVEPIERLLSPGSYDTALRTGLLPKEPHKHLLKRPEPSSAYMQQAMKTPQSLDDPQSLLVILDLNGTLLYRKNRGSQFIPRPKVYEFLHYLFSNHHVMVWSSAKPENVAGMCEKLFTQEQYDQLVAVWARDTLRLSASAYTQKTQVYKQLSWIWEELATQELYPNETDFWGQENTVLIDDSVEKAASEPYNIVQIEEFEGRKEQMEVDVLGQVVKYLEILRAERNVSAYMRRKAFVYDPEESFDWTPFVNDMH